MHHHVSRLIDGQPVLDPEGFATQRLLFQIYGDDVVAVDGFTVVGCTDDTCSVREG